MHQKSGCPDILPDLFVFRFLINHHLLHFIYYKFVPFSSFLLFRYKKKILHPLLLNFFLFGHDLPYDFFHIQVPGSSRADPPQCLSMAWSADGQTLFAGYSDNLIRVWQVMLSIWGFSVQAVHGTTAGIVLLSYGPLPFYPLVYPSIDFYRQIFVKKVRRDNLCLGFCFVRFGYM